MGIRARRGSEAPFDNRGRGRAELLLADRAGVWNARPENRQLPSLLQWMQIRWWTAKKNWTLPQQKMMRKATRYHALRGLTAAACLFVVALFGLTIRERVVEHHQATRAAGLVQSLLNADTAQVPAIIDQLEDYRSWAVPLLKKEFDKEPKDSSRKLHAGLALLRKDKGYLEYVLGRMLEASPQEIWLLHKELYPYQGEVRERLWPRAARLAKGPDQVGLAATCVLACLPVGKDANWPQVSGAVVENVLAAVQKNPSNYPVFLKIFVSVRKMKC